MTGEPKKKNDAAILVVDDNEDNRYTLIRRLKRDGYENVAEAADGQTGLDMLETRPFDLVLLDIMMPGMSGYEVLEQVKSDPDLRAIPVIMISALDEMDSVVKCVELGAEDYLNKPFNPTLLRARVGSSLEKKRMRDHEAAYTSRVEDERKTADILLHSVLPVPAVQELRHGGKMRPRRHDNIAVLFCDLVGFTSYCDRNSPEDVVDRLQDVFTRFEEVAERHGMEKIKTIGDALMATAGLLSHKSDPVLSAVQTGIDLVRVAGELDPPWTVSVGVHIGPVVAGIAGNRPYQFDLWGDTVNTAARICQYAAPGQVLLSSEAWMTARGSIRAKALGLVELKGKGDIELVECVGMKATAAAG